MQKRANKYYYDYKNRSETKSISASIPDGLFYLLAIPVLIYILVQIYNFRYTGGIFGFFFWEETWHKILAAITIIFSLVALYIFIIFSIIADAGKRANLWVERDKRKSALASQYGATGWADVDDLLENLSRYNLSDGENGIANGIWIGEDLHWNGKGHILTVGSNRAGKGTSLIIPALLSPGLANSDTSFICLDPKGENAHVTRNAVAASGADVHVLNPFGIPGLPNSTFNPFDLTSSADPDVIDFCDMIAEMLVPLKGNADATAEYFDDQARTLLSAFMLHMLDEHADKANFGTLFRWVHLTGDPLLSLLSEMVTSTAYHGVVSSLAGGFIETRTSGGEKEASGVLSSARRALAPFKNPRLLAATASSDFDLREIAQRRMGLYVCIPQADMSRNAVWLRMVMGTAMRVLQRHYNPQRKVLFILDEFATLGYMRDFEENAGYLAGCNVSFWVVIQLLPQLQKLYPDIWETFLGNAHIKHFMSIGDVTTSEYVSKMLPKDIQVIWRGDGDPNVVQKKLLDPEEVQNFPKIIAFVAGLDSPIWIEKTPYFSDERFRALADPNPMQG